MNKLKKSLLVLFILAVLILPCYAADTNIDGDGSIDMGSGTGANKWSRGDEGVRVTVVEAKSRKVVSRSVDFANKKQNVDFYFGYKNKISYVYSKELKFQSDNGYTNIQPNIALPSIISSSGQNNIETLKRYFGDRGTIEYISKKLSFDYDKLISGDYVLMLEPIAYLTFGGKRYAGTATEFALLDVMFSRGVAAKMGILTHCNLPRSMYLAKQSIGFPIPRKPFPHRSNNAQIVDTLGIGTVSFKPVPEPVPPQNTIYRTDTDVIISVNVVANREYSPDEMGNVTFNILGSSYTKYFVSPEGGEQFVWIRWHTPSTPQEVTIHITGEDRLSLNTVNASIISPEEVLPPDPQFHDGAPKINEPKVKKNTATTRNSWFTYEAEWNEVLEEWQYSQKEYYAKLETKLRLWPNKRVKTAFDTGGGNYDMKSGYGLNVEYITTVSYWCSDYDITNVQNASATFPEFQYKTYNRLLIPKEVKLKNQLMTFKPNIYSYYLEKTHFTPLRFPDKTKYRITVDGFDMWTPAGELKTTTTNDNITINDNVYDDWYIRPIRD